MCGPDRQTVQLTPEQSAAIALAVHRDRNLAVPEHEPAAWRALGIEPSSIRIIACRADGEGCSIDAIECRPLACAAQWPVEVPVGQRELPKREGVA